TFSGMLFLLVLALLRGNDHGWSSTLIVSLFTGSALLFLAFLVIERRVRDPMLPLALFRIRSFAGVQISAFALSASLYAMFLSLSLTTVTALARFHAGLRSLPVTVLPFVFRGAVGALIGRVPARVLLSVGLALSGAGLLLMSGLTADSAWTALLAGFLLAGAGSGILNPVIAEVGLSVVPRERSGMASGILDTFRQVGVAVGIALWGAVFISRGTDKAHELAAGTPAAAGSQPRHLVEAASQGNLGHSLAALPHGTRSIATHAAHEGFLAGLNNVLTLAGLLSLAGAVLALWLVPEHEIEREPETDPATSKSHPQTDLP